MKKHFKSFVLLSLIEGFLALFLLFIEPSQQSNFLGFSKSRWILGLVQFALLLPLLFIYILIKHENAFPLSYLSKLEIWLLKKNNLFWCLVVFLSFTIFFFGAVLFTFLLIPERLRWLIAWLGILSAQLCVFLRLHFAEKIKQEEFFAPLKVLPSWKNLDIKQRKVFWVIFLIGLLYFIAYIIPNLLDAKDEHMLFLLGGDENNIYPYVIWMLTPGKGVRTILYRIFIFEGYHYGYPFFFLSALVLLPVRLIFGSEFGSQTQINLLLLRQGISLLPMIISVGVMVYLQTKFRHFWRSILLFSLILFMPAVVMYNLRYWHPDALVVLSVVMTIFFLVKDDLNFNINFLLAAIFCGLAASIKFYGFFFFLVIAGYLLTGMYLKKKLFITMFIQGSLFIILMSMTFLLTNPFLFHEPARIRYLEIMEEKSNDMHYGYIEPDPDQIYKTGIEAVVPYLERYNASKYFILFLLISMIGGLMFGENRLLFWVLTGWVIPMFIYLIFFQVLKHFQFWLPVFVPLYSTAFSIFNWDISSILKGNEKKKRKVLFFVQSAAVLLILFQFAQNLYLAFPQFSEWLRFCEIF